MTDRRFIYGVVFDEPERTKQAVTALRSHGFSVVDVQTPFAVHGMDEAMGLAPTRIPWATFVGGALGFALAAALQVWTHTVDWPLDIGGKDSLAWPALVPVAFELTVLLAAFATVGALFAASRLWPRWKGETPPEQFSPEVSDDSFVILVEERDGGFSFERLREVSNAHGARSVLEPRRAS